MDTGSLESRMRQYEDAQKTRLTRRLPVMIRVDGNAFHTLTRGFDRPFDEVLNKTMRDTMQYLCENIHGCVLGYTQSDEITLLLKDYNNKNQGAWFDYVKRKIESISASMATMAFNRFFVENVTNKRYFSDLPEAERRACDKYFKASGKAMFDSRAFNIPEFEVSNNFIFRQKDCIRNSIQSVGQANFSQRELHNKKCDDIKKMLLEKRDIDWDKLPTHYQRGSCCVKVEKVFNEGKPDEFRRNKWVVDTEIPLFTENRDYINSRFMNLH